MVTYDPLSHKPNHLRDVDQNDVDRFSDVQLETVAASKPRSEFDQMFAWSLRDIQATEEEE